MKYDRKRLIEMMEKLNPTFKVKSLHENLTPQNLNQIFSGYIEAALWTEEERLKDDAGFNHEEDEDDFEGESPEQIKFMKIMKNKESKPFESFTREDINPDSLIKAYTDIKEFIRLAGDQAVQEAVDVNGYERLGHDIWLTRNGHGAGFFDHSYEHEQELMNAAKALKEVDLYLSDDMKLEFSNAHL